MSNDSQVYRNILKIEIILGFLSDDTVFSQVRDVFQIREEFEVGREKFDESREEVAQSGYQWEQLQERRYVYDKIKKPRKPSFIKDTTIGREE